MYFMSTVCGRPQGEGGVWPMWTEGKGGVKNVIFFVDVINGWPQTRKSVPFDEVLRRVLDDGDDKVSSSVIGNVKIDAARVESTWFAV